MRDRISRVARRDNPGAPLAHPRPAAPWWARVFVRGGQPLAVVVVMIMCAPGEHHLARLAGWNDHLAWGMAALLAGYAGMAAFLAGERRPGTPGHWTAVLGAGLALALAMAAQPVSHMFATGWLTAEPRTPLWLVIVVSCVPAPVLGHILHLAATPVRQAAPEPAEQLPAEAEHAELSHEQGQQLVRDVLGIPEPTEQPKALTTWPTEQPPTADEQGEPDAEQHPEQPERDRFLSTREVADRYGVTMSTVGTWLDRGRITRAFQDPRRGNLYDPETLPPLASAG
ncbi:hypothetical protein [Streptomyces sp. NBC_00842]|uniref:hypothetical protein n=1 Tax=Streptomyces sp. NBC_00842 TaxID=2975848 RepID=UPI00386C1B5A|nr:hypothetical protein OH821_17075 [Streptomyces sp. NBC_00842]